jgi:hypothetical protein
MHIDRWSIVPLNDPSLRVNAHEVDESRRDEFLLTLVQSSALFLSPVGSAHFLRIPEPGRTLIQVANSHFRTSTE